MREGARVWLQVFYREKVDYFNKNAFTHTPGPAESLVIGVVLYE